MEIVPGHQPDAFSLRQWGPFQIGSHVPLLRFCGHLSRLRRRGLALGGAPPRGPGPRLGWRPLAFSTERVEKDVGTAGALAAAVIRPVEISLLLLATACVGGSSNSASVDAPAPADAPSAHPDAPAPHVDAPPAPGADAPSVAH